MAERFNAPVLKTGDGVTRPWVRIPLPPLVNHNEIAINCSHFKGLRHAFGIGFYPLFTLICRDGVEHQRNCAGFQRFGQRKHTATSESLVTDDKPVRREQDQQTSENPACRECGFEMAEWEPNELVCPDCTLAGLCDPDF